MPLNIRREKNNITFVAFEQENTEVLLKLLFEITKKYRTRCYTSSHVLVFARRMCVSFFFFAKVLHSDSITNTLYNIKNVLIRTMQKRKQIKLKIATSPTICIPEILTSKKQIQEIYNKVPNIGLSGIYLHIMLQLTSCST